MFVAPIAKIDFFFSDSIALSHSLSSLNSRSGNIRRVIKIEEVKEEDTAEEEEKEEKEKHFYFHCAPLTEVEEAGNV